MALGPIPDPGREGADGNIPPALPPSALPPALPPAALPAPPPEGDLTQVLRRMGADGADLDEDLIRRVYSELRHVASFHLRAEHDAFSLQPTALVHEAYLRLAGRESWTDRGHFFRVAAKVMRQILVDHARARRAKKRGGDEYIVQLSDALPEPAAHQSLSVDELLALDEAISELSRRDARQAQVVELRFFCGLSETEVCESLSISPRTARREWDHARAFLFGRLKRSARKRKEP
jgi:RNA polymerase sigma factor (TIGR02999 family)